MDGLWSSPDLPALLAWPPCNREALALVGGWWRLPLQLAADARASRPPEHARRQPPEHRGALRPRQRLLPAVPRRDDDLFERGLRDARPVARRRAARTSTRSSPSAPASTRGEHVLEIGTGWGGFALYAAGELGCRVTTITISPAQHALAAERIRGRWAGGPGQRPAARLPRHHRDLRRHRLDRDARGRRGRVLRDLLRGLRPGASPGGRMSLQTITFPDAAYERAAARRELDPDLHLPGRPAARRWPPSSGRSHGTRLLVRGVDDIAAHYVLTLRAWRAALPGPPRRGPRAWASTSGSSGCGSTTSRSARPASRRGSARTSRSSSRSAVGSTDCPH